MSILAGGQVPIWADATKAQTEAVARATGELGTGRATTSGVVVLARRLGNAAARHGGRVSPPSLQFSSLVTGVAADVRFQSLGEPGDELHCWTSATPPGLYQLSSNTPLEPAVPIAVWPGWQTLVFVPCTAEGAVTTLVTVHCVPIHAGWNGADRLTELSAQLQSALADETPVTPTGLEAFRRELAVATAAAGQPTPPLVDLLLAHLALDAEQPSIADQHRSALDSVGAADIVPAELAALDLLAGAHGARDAVVTTPPCLARSGDALIRWEARQPGRIQPPASDMFAGAARFPAVVQMVDQHDACATVPRGRRRSGRGDRPADAGRRLP